MSIIPYGRQEISQADIDAVVGVLRSDFLTQGPVVPAFESAVAQYCNAQYAVAVNSATSALHIACLALGIGKGDLVWTSPITFVATSNCALYCGAIVDFVDIDPCTYNLSVARLEEKLVGAKEAGKLPKAIIPVHLCGQSCDMLGIHKLSQQYGFKIIEDASHAIGGKYKNEAIGNCRYSDITVFSFHPVKIITSGEGGMAVTNDPVYAERMLQYRTHGLTSNPDQMELRARDEIWNYQQILLGYNYRMTDIQAALGLSQMSRLDEFVERRHKIAASYDEAFSGLPLITPFQHPDSSSSYHIYPIRVRESTSGRSQRQVVDELWKANIAWNLHYIPVYRQPYYEAIGFQAGYCPQAELYHKEAISLPMFPALTAADQEWVITSLREILK
jgi:UDP-4-amino-4,6-dideoxy-N-acetyl-beta-L-altrosamine transaminase